VSAQYAYMANFGSNTVSVFDIVSNKVVATIPVGINPIGVTITPDGSRTYVTNNYSNDVSVIDNVTNMVITTIPVQNPYGIAANKNGSLVYVTANDGLSVISTATNTVTTTIPNTNGGLGIVVSPDGSKFYAACGYSQVLVFDTATNAQLASIGGAGPYDLAISPDGSRLYTADSGYGSVSVINTTSNSVMATIAVGNVGIQGIAVSPDGKRVYATGSSQVDGSGVITVIDAATNIIVNTIKLDSNLFGISVSPDGSRLYIPVDNNEAVVRVVSTSTNSVIASIPVGVDPISFGSFISPVTSCNSSPVEYTITVNPTPPAITAGAVTGVINACSGSSSVSPYIQQFTVSGSKLTGDITATAPAGFELSIAPGGEFGNSVTLTQSAGDVNSTVIYVRSAASASAGNISGQVKLTSPGTKDQLVAVAATVSVHVDPSVSIVVSSNNVCAGAPVTFTATPVNGGKTPDFQWRINGNNTGTNSSTFASSTLASGDDIDCVMTSNYPCASPVNTTSNGITITLTKQVTPSVSIVSSTNNICSGTPVTFSASLTNGGNSPMYRWLVNGNNTGVFNTDFTTTNLVSGDIVSCIMTSNADCALPVDVASNDILMNVYPLPVISAGGDKTINAGGDVQLNATATGNIEDVTWSPATGLSNNKILNPVASPTVTITYTLIVKTKDGCVAMDEATVKLVAPNLIIPNTFTPNGDGINDTWNIKDLDYYANCTVQVFTRYGQSVFSSIGYGIPWDGTYKGVKLPTGTYYYVIDLKNDTKYLSGFIALLR